MKPLTIASILAILCFAFCLPGCTSSPDSISQRTIINQYNAELHNNAMDIQVAKVQTGTYECNDPQARLILRELQAAGLLTYNVTRYCWWEKSKKNERRAYTVTRGYWYTYETTEYKTVKVDAYDFIDHYIVNVALTDKGQKLELDPPTPVEKEDKDLKSPEVDPSKYAWNNVDLSEYWPDVPNPFLKPMKTDPTSSTASNSSSSSHRSSSNNSSAHPEKVERIDSLQYQAYLRVNEETDIHFLKAASVKAFKARNIQIDQTNGAPKAKAEVICRTEKVTDVGRIFFSLENDIRFKSDVTLDYYVDKGWILQDLELDDE